MRVYPLKSKILGWSRPDVGIAAVACIALPSAARWTPSDLSELRDWSNACEVHAFKFTRILAPKDPLYGALADRSKLPPKLPTSPFAKWPLVEARGINLTRREVQDKLYVVGRVEVARQHESLAQFCQMLNATEFADSGLLILFRSASGVLIDRVSAEVDELLSAVIASRALGYASETEWQSSIPQKQALVSNLITMLVRERAVVALPAVDMNTRIALVVYFPVNDPLPPFEKEDPDGVWHLQSDSSWELGIFR